MMDWESDEVQAMMANTTVDISELSTTDDEDYAQPIFAPPVYAPPFSPISTPPSIQQKTNENGVLSFENPNYILGNSLDDALNSNTQHTSTTASIPEEIGTTDNALPLDGGLSALDSLYTELDHVCNLTRASSVRTRRQYAQLDVGSMGVDVTTGPITNLDQADHQNNRTLDKTKVANTNDDNNKTLEKHEDSNNGITHIPHMTAGLSEDLYALPVKRNQETAELQEEEEEKQDNCDSALPPGWEKHEDNDGPYYWHIKSGTITRTPPGPGDLQQPLIAPTVTLRRHKDHDQMHSSVTRSNTSSALSELTEGRSRSTALDNAYKRRSYPARSELSEPGTGRPIRFAVRSLGWVEIAEDDLTPERSSKAVNRCIVDLSMGRRDVLDVVGRWGDGKDLFMDLDEGSLKLVDPENLTLLNTQPIHTIRVWGVGRDNGRDFAYVARDKINRKHMCHVFRCDTPARTIANTLRDICKKIMIERSLQQSLSKGDNMCMSGGGLGGSGTTSPSSRLSRPTNLPTEHRRFHRHSQVIPSQSFPTPMEEPKKVMRAQYVGVVQVTKPAGIEVLNAAIEAVADENPKPWRQVTVAVAPSTVTITSVENGQQLAECRVRFLSFLGIGQNVKFCAFIMHTAQDQFLAYVFYCEPSSGALCKTIEAACKLRYQKCLDAHPGGVDMRNRMDTPKSISATLKSVFTSITGRKARSADS